MAQSGGEVTTLMPSIHTFMGSYNPSYCYNESHFEAKIGYYGYQGLRSNTRQIIAQAGISKENSQKRTMYYGLNVRSSRRGLYLASTRAHFVYNWGLKLNGWDFVAGGAIGVYNAEIKPNPADVVGSSTILDGNFGLKLQNEKVTLGLAINQLFNNTFQVYKGERSLQRNYVMSGDFVLFEGIKWKVEPGLLFRYMESRPMQLGPTTKIEFAEQVGFRGTFVYNQGLFFNLYANRLGKSDQLGVEFAYDSPFGNGIVFGLWAYQLSLIYSLK